MLLLLPAFAVYLCNTKMHKSVQNFFSANSNPNTTTTISAITFFAKEAEIQDKTQRYLSNKAYFSTANKFPLRVPEADLCRILVQNTMQLALDQTTLLVLSGVHKAVDG